MAAMRIGFMRELAAFGLPPRPAAADARVGRVAPPEGDLAHVELAFDPASVGFDVAPGA